MAAEAFAAAQAAFPAGKAVKFSTGRKDDRTTRAGVVLGVHDTAKGPFVEVRPAGQSAGTGGVSVRPARVFPA